MQIFDILVAMGGRLDPAQLPKQFRPLLQQRDGFDDSSRNPLKRTSSAAMTDISKRQRLESNDISGTLNLNNILNMGVQLFNFFDRFDIIICLNY